MTEKETVSLGKRLEMARAHVRFTQTQVEQLTGISQSRISRIENGRVTNLRTGTLRKLARAYKCTLGSLLD